MEYADIVDVYDRLAATDSTIEKREILADAFGDAGDHLPRLVTLVRGRLGPAYDRPDLGVSSSLTLEAVLSATGADEADVRDQWRETGDLGDAAAWAVENGGQQTLFSQSLTVEGVHETLRDIAAYEGEGSQGKRVDAIAGLVANADANEARYVVRTALGHMRVGVGEGTIRDAIAHAFLDGSDEAVDAVERAYQVTNDFRVVATTARDEGIEALDALDVALFRPIQSMLAEKAETLADGLEGAAADDDVSDWPEDASPEDDSPDNESPVGESSDASQRPADVAGRVYCEYKYDGVRVQVHVDGDDVRLFTRRLEDVTEQFPDVVAAVEAGVSADSVVLDGELVGYTPDTVAAEETAMRDPVPFQDLSQRIKREADVDAMAREVPVVVHLFDCLYDGETRIEEPLVRRLDALEDTFERVPPEPTAGVAGLEGATAAWASPENPAPAEALYQKSLDAGHEGLMLKNPAASYQPGRRVGRLLKLKPTMEPLDLVVSRATYSEGRRSELLGRLYLACYDPEADAFREVGRLSTGYTDEELQSITERLEALVTSREGRHVELDPQVVLEVEYEEIQESPEYGSGYALRFPRFLGVRDDLAPKDADTVERVQSLYDSQ